ncbi:hypothetical protein GOP47_0009911 [Adiantum capillus-veneris]|uniref:Uncharacterized protein n=1 Tax=Adiantum capillus-veneris TaxID=13818 RepID=A0A9D4ZK51_ADICA|nr:hypothetical protein GOP47_0009911 [Adiantum capillus-veneris]
MPPISFQLVSLSSSFRLEEALQDVGSWLRVPSNSCQLPDVKQPFPVLSCCHPSPSCSWLSLPFFPFLLCLFSQMPVVDAIFWFFSNSPDYSPFYFRHFFSPPSLD